MIHQIDAQSLFDEDAETLKNLRDAIENVGFLTLSNSFITSLEVENTINAYKKFFKSEHRNKEIVDMSQTGSNRGWGKSGLEQVDPNSNPDYKEIFDCGVEVSKNDPQAYHSVYANNMWPPYPDNFKIEIEDYFKKTRQLAFQLLKSIAFSIGQDATFFDDKFDKPMALLRGNYYPERPVHATDKDFGIAPHTDYGCITLLSTDGTPGLEVQLQNGQWKSVQADPGTFIINFGEMLEIWSGSKVRATPHRVLGGKHERISIPLFFNPNYDTNVAAPNADPVSAGEYLSRRYNETYTHLKK